MYGFRAQYSSLDMVIRLPSTVPELPGAVPGERLWVVTLAERELPAQLAAMQSTNPGKYKTKYKSIHSNSELPKYQSADWNSLSPYFAQGMF